ncbi:DnaB-like helicase C-terminal domain-containing protein [Neobacillus soli]|uniref:DnaB-like helicase C-terminal domain-containing protein n=1 Tax=Neobacillus soli TaxID=220688 RepID=UPI0008245DA3|nr:DnaB-like helicase C-terminal domain-containing protein [Neobacillus soli]
MSDEIKKIKEKHGLKSAEEIWGELKQESIETSGRIPSFMNGMMLNGKILDFDTDILNGGYFRSVSHVVSAFPGSGKTTFCTQQSALQGFNHYRVLYLTLEQSEFEIIEKMLGTLGGKSYSEFENIKYQNPDDFEKQKAEAQRLLKAYFGGRVDVKSGIYHVNQILTFLEEVVKEQIYDIIYIDNIQNVRSNPKAKETKSEQLMRLTNLTKDILAKYRTTALIWLSQLSNDSGYKNPKNAKPKWCTDINDDCSTFITLHTKHEGGAEGKGKNEKKHEPEDIDKTYIDVSKNRKGTKGFTFENGAFRYDKEKERIGSFALPSLEEQERRKFGAVMDKPVVESGETTLDELFSGFQM